MATNNVRTHTPDLQAATTRGRHAADRAPEGSGGDLGTLLKQAMRGKALQLNARYTFRDLERDSGVSFTHASKVVNGLRTASREVIEAWARVLAPYLPLDEALLAAGYLPPTRDDVLRRLGTLPDVQLETLERIAVVLGYLPA